MCLQQYKYVKASVTELLVMVVESEYDFMHPLSIPVALSTRHSHACPN